VPRPHTEDVVVVVVVVVAVVAVVVAAVVVVVAAVVAAVVVACTRLIFLEEIAAMVPAPKHQCVDSISEAYRHTYTHVGRGDCQLSGAIVS
jgi:hypothetical protein